MPWLVALGLLAWLFHIVPVDALREAVRQASMVAFVGLCLLFVPLLLLADGLATWVTIRRALPETRLSYAEVIRLRGATYLLAILHYGVGQGGIAYFLKSRHGVPLARAAGAVMLTMGVNFMMVATCAAVGLLLGGAPAAPGLRLLVLGLAAGMPVYLAVVAFRPGFLSRFKLLQPIFDAGLGGNLIAAAARLPHLATLIAGNFAMMHVFGVHPPLGEALTLLPIVFVVATLPLSPSGLGTAQTMAVALFAPYALGISLEEQQARVLAYSLGFQFGGLLLQAVIGVVFLRLMTGAGTLGKTDDVRADDVP